MTQRPYETDELNALPVGTIFTLRQRVNPRYDLTVWKIVQPGAAQLVSHGANEMENDLMWFTHDYDIEVIGFDQSLIPHGKDEKLRIYINRKLDITPNKRAAHAVHAALHAFGVHPGVKVIVLDKGPTQIEKMRVAIHDAGHTELEPGTLTAGTDWPHDSEA